MATITKRTYSQKQQRARLNQLVSIPLSEWAAIYCALNKWEYPARLRYKPKWWDKQMITNRKHSIIDPLMDIIHWGIGEKATMDEWSKDLSADKKYKNFLSRLRTEIKTKI